MNDVYINDFLLYLEMDLNYSKNTINTYENSLNQLNKFINKAYSSDIKNMTKLALDLISEPLEEVKKNG